MISVIAQERLLGFALGNVFTGLLIFEERNNIYRFISSANHLDAQRVAPTMFGNKSQQQLELSHLWNKAVDQTLGPVIAALSSRGW
ncbi:hypothetical protein ACHQM5_010047 [Ranunculus cassubicifolius]